jgi:hypothetical protein
MAYVDIGNSTEKTPSLKPNSRLASQEIPRFLCNPKDQCRFHKNPPSDSSLSQSNLSTFSRHTEDAC